MGDKAKSAWAWLKKWGAWLFGGIAAVLLAVLGGGWLWRRKTRELGRVKDRLAVAEATKRRAHLQGVREEIKRQVGEDDEAISEIDDQLKTNAREIADAHEGGKDMTDEEVLDELARLGL